MIELALPQARRRNGLPRVSRWAEWLHPWLIRAIRALLWLEYRVGWRCRLCARDWIVKGRAHRRFS